MELLRQLESQFTADVRNRAASYVSRVRIQERSPEVVRATVRGSATYELRIERDDDGVEAWCTCPYFESSGPCKHLYALLVTLAVDPQARRAPRLPSWRRALDRIAPPASTSVPVPIGPGTLVYLIDAVASAEHRVAVVEVALRPRKQNGELGKPKALPMTAAHVAALSHAADREIVAQLTGVVSVLRYNYGYVDHYGYGRDESRQFRLSGSLSARIVAAMCATGRCHLRRADGQLSPPLSWDDGVPWQICLELGPATAGHHRVTPLLRRRDGATLAAGDAELLAGGVLVVGSRAAAFDDDGDAARWARFGDDHGPLALPSNEALDFIAAVLAGDHPPQLTLPPELTLAEVAPAPRPRLRLTAEDRRYSGIEKLQAQLSFEYDGVLVDGDQPGGGAILDREQGRIIRRDRDAEGAAVAELERVGFRQRRDYYGREVVREIGARHLGRVVAELGGNGWHLEVQGRRLRMPEARELSVSSGIDWFELQGAVQFGDQRAELPELLRALRRGDDAITLADGSQGILPVAWLQRLGLVAELAGGDALRFGRGQAALLDALLATHPEVNVDAEFARMRAELARFDGIAPADAPAGFVGALRDYQRDGLGWLHFLQRLGCGGCLADDMGLGKTVQVLALLLSRRGQGPSLVVVPRSLVFNWVEEAGRFAPGLRLLIHSGQGRDKLKGARFADSDVVLTTYGTLRQDAQLFAAIEFDYVILDEAQAIKNASSGTAKAARLLRGRHRLALTGTPMENHLGELGSLFRFLNPTLLGKLELKPEHADVLARALRPYLLRRTKDQVARELPAKLEQTLYCELDTDERQRYDELRDHYRASLLSRIEREGIAKSKLQVLEALLRLRQAACHPGLIDKKRIGESSAKLDALLPQLAEVVDGGHKALVFSQFTSLLAIVRARLDAQGLAYEYLDGKTRDRQARVARFQEDPACKLFLVSLKAGGVGLNLTAAEYVFLLDPWWNPAVEAQAIDRAHRIGQARQVFAYRLIARDTVEEKVLALQRDKRQLADAIIRADESLVRTLRREDLQLLLS